MSTSTCNCDGTFTDIGVLAEIFGRDDLLTGINTDPLSGGFDPRPGACQQAVSELIAEGQDPCNLDSPDDLQVLYKQFITTTFQTGQQTPVSNPLQKAANIALGTATASTPVNSGSKPAAANNMLFIIGAIVVLAIGFILVFK
jgi:hypothetical protein